MKEEKTKSKRKLIYYIVLAVSVLLLIAATVLTVYFVTDDGEPVLDAPPITQPDENEGNTDPVPDNPGEEKDPAEPSGGETVRFIAPVNSTTYTMDYAAIYSNEVMRWIYRHKAIDFVAAEGETVRAMCDGTVECIFERPETGKYITVDHGDGIKTTYRFLEIGQNIRVGDKIKQGDPIGTVAAAYGIEKAEGTHLHLEMKKNGDFVNPLDYIDVVFDEK